MWNCTWDESAVRDIENPETREALTIQILKYRQGVRRIFRERVDGTRGIHKQPTILPIRSPGVEALNSLVMAILSGQIFHHVRHVDTGRWAPIPEHERAFLDFQIHPDDPLRPYGFGSRDPGTLRYLMPRISVQDVKRLFPAPGQRPTAAGEKRILDRLLEITAGKKWKKPQAMQVCKSVQGYSARGFERAWKSLPPERKLGRGEHGPRIKH